MCPTDWQRHRDKNHIAEAVTAICSGERRAQNVELWWWVNSVRHRNRGEPSLGENPAVLKW